jgi:excisionase family DNA binding protein
MQRFIDMFENAHRALASDWLTVDEVAKELKISKSIVYRIIRKGELKAVDLTDSTEKIARRGHYRIRRSNLNQYLEKKQVKSLPDLPEHTKQSHRLPKVKNHLGL